MGSNLRGMKVADFLRQDIKVTRRPVRFRLNGTEVEGFAGESVAAALGALGLTTLRHAPRSGSPRGAFCLMGVCQECLCRIDGARREACRTPLRAGMEVQTLG